MSGGWSSERRRCLIPHGIWRNNYNIAWDSAFDLPFEERVKGKKILSEMSEEECVEFVMENLSSIPNEYRFDHFGEFIKETIKRIEEYPYAPSPYSALDTAYIADTIRASVVEYYDIHNKRPKLSEMSREETLEFVYSRDIEIPTSLDIDSVGEFVKSIIVKAEENSDDYPTYFLGDPKYFAESIRNAVNKYYAGHEEPKLSEMSEEECLEFIVSCGIEIPDNLKDGLTAALVHEMLNRADQFSYYSWVYENPDEILLYGQIEKAVIEYYDLSGENPKLSELRGAECYDFLSSCGIEIPIALRSEYMEELVFSMIAKAEEHPYIYESYNYFSVFRISESIRKVVNEYYGIYTGHKKLSEISEDECVEFIKSSGVRIPYGMESDNFGADVKIHIIHALENPQSIPGYGSTLQSYLADSIRKAVNEYYFMRFDNYRLEWRPEFEAEYYNH